MEIAVAITGASGVIIGVRLVEVLAAQGTHRLHLLISAGAKEVLAHEIGPLPPLPADYFWEADDLTAPIASSSRAPQAMVVAPCSMKTLAAIAQGYSNDLVGRVADAMLRLNRPLVLMPRETPLSLAAIENMRRAKLAGAVILPPVAAYYHRPQSVNDMTDFFVGKVLDALGLPHNLYRRWGETG